MYQAAMRYQVAGLKELSEEIFIEGLATVRSIGTKVSFAMFDPKLQEVMLPKLRECMGSLMQSSPFSNLLIKYPHFGLDILRAEYAPGCQPPAVTPMTTPNSPHVKLPPDGPHFGGRDLTTAFGQLGFSTRCELRAQGARNIFGSGF